MDSDSDDEIFDDLGKVHFIRQILVVLLQSKFYLIFIDIVNFDPGKFGHSLNRTDLLPPKI